MLLSAVDDDRIVLVDGQQSYSCSELRRAVFALSGALCKRKITKIALHADNGIDWIIADLACLAAGILVIPLPLFFSPAQLAHAIANSGADALLCDHEPLLMPSQGVSWIRESDFDWLRLYRIEQVAGTAPSLPEATQKITFTSGTTGAPKGVCLSASNQLTVAQSLADTIPLDAPRHLCILPLSTLLENVAGVYAPLLSVGTVIVPSLAEVGLTGSSQLDLQALVRCIAVHRPNSIILVPELLTALVAAANQGWVAPDTLQFIAVGGGKVSAELLAQAHAAGLPAYEGYGLSECASVVALNVPGDDSPGTAGRVLPHLAVSIEDDEIVVRGNTFLGYAGSPDSWDRECVHTGDLGTIDTNGFINIEGRRKNLMITSYGRNISPEWIESELLAGPLLQQAIVFGDARPYCVALLRARDPETSIAEIERWLSSINAQLPDYARVRAFELLERPLSAADSTLTENGRPRRNHIYHLYAPVIDGLYVSYREACQS